jgi:hypothetical protein
MFTLRRKRCSTSAGIGVHDGPERALKRVGHDIARNTIKAILQDHGVEPAPERGAKMSWKTFLAAHWEGLAADFFTVEVLTLRGLVRYVVLFVMKLKTRAVEIAGITSEPDGAWMTQRGRNLTDAGDGFLRGVQYVILDRDPLYTAAFRRLLRDSGVTWCSSVNGTSGPPCERLCSIIMKNGRIRVWATSSSRLRQQ